MNQRPAARSLRLYWFALLTALTALATASPYSAEPPPRLRLLVDFYHHAKPSTRIGNHIISGSWTDNVGRYGWDDFVHTNTLDPLFIALGKEFAIRIHEEPYTDAVLANADAVLLINPDNPRLNPKAVILTDGEIAALQQFVRAGGSLIIMTNSGGRSDEDFEGVQLRKLLRSFGLDCNRDDTHYSDNVVGPEHPWFYDVPVFHYGAGCTIQILPHAERPAVLMENYSDAGYPDRNVRGPGMVLVRPGKGKVILVGDTGSWTGNMSRPWAENTRVLQQLFRQIKLDLGVAPAQWSAGKSLTYEMTVTGLDAIPKRNTISAFPRPHHRNFSPRPITNIPYFEASAQVALKCAELTSAQAARIGVNVTGFRWFDTPSTTAIDQSARFTASRQGKVSGLTAEGEHAIWLAPDLPLLIALLPCDGLRPGDRWETVEPMRIPTVLGTDMPAVKSVTIELVYAGEETVAGHNCRLLRAEGEVWLDSIGVRADDLLPFAETRQIGGANHEFFHPRGGKLMYKREQWVDRDTGIVVKARAQSRTLVWLHDKRLPVQLSNAEKDIEMIASLAHVITFDLKP